MELQDLDKFPFGRYKDQPMQDVPASYLHWCWHEASYGRNIEMVWDYIRRSIDALKDENKDLVWNMNLHKK